MNDANDMANALSQCGFKVTLLLDATQRQMESAVREFGKTIHNGDVSLFYYAGHGMQLKGQNYLIPINALIESESDVKYESLNAGHVLGKMEDAESAINIVFLDACRNNPLARSFRNPNRGLARIDAPMGTIIAYSTSPGSVAADGEDRNSPFTKHLLENIKKPELTIEKVLKNVRVAVAAESINKQVPWESSSLLGEFYFSSGTGSSKSITKQPLSLNASLKTNHQESNEVGKSIKLAFFPSIIPGHRSKSLIISGLDAALKSYPKMELVFSYYNPEIDFRYQEEYLKFRKYLKNQKTEELWYKKQSFFESRIHKTELIYRLGHLINVDAVVIFNIPSLATTSGYDCLGSLETHILDIKNQRMITHRNMPDCNNEVPGITKLIKKNFDELQKIIFQ